MTETRRQRAASPAPAANAPLKRKLQKKKSVAVPVLLYVLLYIFCTVMAVGNTLPEKKDIAVGMPSYETITAPRTIVDEISTELLRQEEMEKVSPVYKLDEEVMEESESAITADFRKIERVRSKAKAIAQQQIGAAAGDFSAKDINWQNNLSADDVSELMSLAPGYFTVQDVYTVAAMEADQITSLRDALIERVRTQYNKGIIAEDVPAMLLEIRSAFIGGGLFTSEQAQLAVAVAQNNVKANKTLDAEATELARQAAADAVAPVEYQKGQTIVREGDILTEGQFELIRKLGLLGDDTSYLVRWIAEILLMGALFAGALAYVLVADRSMAESVKNALSIVLLTAFSVAAAALCKLVDIRLNPVFVPVILAAAFLRRRTALAYGAFMSVVIALVMAPVDEFVFDGQAMRMVLSGITGSAVAVLMLRKKQHRGEYVMSGVMAGVVCAVVYLCYGLLETYSVQRCLILVAFGLVNGLAGGLLSVGLLPVWENVFSFTTPSKLLELSNPSGELLRRLMIEAPGTYHHSVMTANLAEAAAEVVGADALLARVAAYYHDVGKLAGPVMFKENQLHVANPHDNMAPRESAQVIIRHVKNGAALADKHKLPRKIRDIIAQHHGDSLAAYFYYQEKQKNPQLNEKDFRYPGPKPQTKEAGVVMLADVVEAALRASGLKDVGEIKALIHKLVKAKVDDGQLEDCPLSQKEIKRVEEAFFYVYEGANHERIAYPKEDDE
ncbi:MAG: HDIG domain-containing protein [Christensenellaceae bacterium]|nr:HDIG domain-containing protein [Christensenellaceae bacterium]